MRDAGLKNQARIRLVGTALLVWLAVVSCEDGPVYTDLRIYDSPYSGVDWAGDVRLKAQHHDHIGTNPERILAYDTAGYDVISLMDYSGNPRLSYARKQRLWPPDDLVTATTRAALGNIRFFIPNAEEVGVDQHATSPFLETYIERGPPDRGSIANWQYRSIGEMFSVIRAEGGIPCLAHPWSNDYRSVQGTFCTEMYSAFAEARRYQGEQDRNVRLMQNWDRALAFNQRAFGIAVNDHFGPYSNSVPESIRDSGKILVIAKEPTLASYREAFETGRILAIRDGGVVKDQFPAVLDVAIYDESIAIESTGNVAWISHGLFIEDGPVLSRATLPPNARYVRAEISAPDGSSTVFTQAFPVRPVGDIDGDYDIDDADDAICNRVSAGTEDDELYIAACDARTALAPAG